MIGETRAMKRRRVGMSCWAITVTLTRPQPDTTVCTIIGKIDMDTTPVLRDAVAEARGDDNAHLVIDLSAVSSMDTTGCTFCLKPFENTTSAAVVIYQP